MARPRSVVAPEWWDYTTLDRNILDDAAKLSADDLLRLARPGFEVVFYDSLDEFYLAEALEYVEAWKLASRGAPAGICGPVGPTEQLPLVARLVNAMQLDLSHAHFWAMDEWVLNGREVPADHPLSFEKANRQLCFNRIDAGLKMPPQNLHFPKVASLPEYTASYDAIRCVVMQGGQGEVKHWAFNDPLPRTGDCADAPPPPEDYKKLPARVVDLHPMTIIQNARTSGGGQVSGVPTQALTVGAVETFKADRVSIWHAGTHDNPFGMRLTTLMISQNLVDTAVPISLLALHPNVRFSFYTPAIGTCETEMH